MGYHVNKDDGNRRADAGDYNDPSAEEAEEHCLAYEYMPRNIHKAYELNNISPVDGVRFGSDNEHKLCCLLYVIRFYLHLCRKGWPMVVCLSRARNVLYQLLSPINVYETINTRNSFIAYIMIYKFIVHLVCGYNMDGGGYCSP